MQRYPFPSEIALSEAADEQALANPRGQISVLVADDDARLRQLLMLNLKLLGYAVVGAAKNGREAVDLAQKLQPDLVILDLDMPVMTGFDAGAKIARHLRSAIIICTGCSDDSTLHRASSLGIGAYLVKPFSPAQLKAAAHLALGQRRERGQVLETVAS